MHLPHPLPQDETRPCWGGRGHGSLNGRQFISVSCQWDSLETHPLECGERCSWGSVSWKHFAAQPPEEQGARRCWWPLGAAGCPDCRSLVLGKPPKFRSQLNKSIATSRQNSALQGFPHTLYSQSLTTAAWQRKLYKGPRSISTERAKRVKLELTGNESITSTLCNLRKARRCPVSPPKIYLPIPKEYYHFYKSLLAGTCPLSWPFCS